MPIIPAILVPTYQELKKQLKQTEPFFDYVQIDIMDGQFVNNKSFNYNDDRDLNKFFNNEIETKLKYELHLMVKNPLDEIAKWEKVKNVFRVIFHIECDDEPMKILAKIKENGWQAGVALNPETPIENILPYLNQIKMLLFMTVHPGKQGNLFVEEVGKKVKKLIDKPPLKLPLIKGEKTNRPIIAVDGGINEKNIALVKSWGVEIFNVGSALMKTNNIEKEHQKLKQIINN